MAIYLEAAKTTPLLLVRIDTRAARRRLGWLEWHGLDVARKT
jgi:hypothetical protein